jgi:ribosome-associated protein
VYCLATISVKHHNLFHLLKIFPTMTQHASPGTVGAVQQARIDTDYIELDKLLKRENLTASGGEARYLISQGLVLVNGIVELRKRRKLRSGDVVTCGETTLRVEGPSPAGAAGDPTGEKAD